MTGSRTQAIKIVPHPLSGLATAGAAYAAQLVVGQQTEPTHDERR